MPSAAVEAADRRRAGEELEIAEVLDLAEDADDYQHALVHAGKVPAVDEDGEPSDVCPACGARLGGL